MAYSRWIESRFYTFWCILEKDTENIADNQCFELCDIPKSHKFTYKELKEDLEGCLDIICDFYSKEQTGTILDLTDPLSFDFSRINEWKYVERTFQPYPVTEEERSELKGYMLEFIEDVEREFKK